MRLRRPRLGAAAIFALVLLGASACGTGDAGSQPGPAESWRRLARAPLSPRVGHSAVWTGTEMLIWGGLRAARSGRSEVALADGAAYQPATRTWRPIAPAPLAGKTALWTGTELLAFGRVGAGSQPRLGGAAYDPRTGSWRRLATSPLPAANEFRVVLAGARVAAFSYRDSERACRGGLFDLATGTWHTIGSCPLLPIMYPQPIWTGSRIALLTLGSEWFDGGEVNPWPARVYTNGIYDPATSSWTRPAPRPAGLQPGYGGQFVWTGREVLLWGLGGGVAYDPTADSWRSMAKAPFTREFSSQVWTGTEMLVWGGATGQDCVDGCPRADGLAYRPIPG